MDVVAVAPLEDRWTHPPFGGVVADGFVWGRGALDLKYSVAGLLEAVSQLLLKGWARHPVCFPHCCKSGHQVAR